MIKIIYYTPKVVVAYCCKGHGIKVQCLSMYTCLRHLSLHCVIVLNKNDLVFCLLKLVYVCSTSSSVNNLFPTCGVVYVYIHCCLRKYWSAWLPVFHPISCCVMISSWWSLIVYVYSILVIVMYCNILIICALCDDTVLYMFCMLHCKCILVCQNHWHWPTMYVCTVIFIVKKILFCVKWRKCFAWK